MCHFTEDDSRTLRSFFRRFLIKKLSKLKVSAYPKVRWSARRALRSRGDTGCFERGLVSRRAREAEKRDGEVRFSVRPCLPELELSALSFILHPPSVPLEYRGMIARHIESRYFITTTTRHSLTLPPGTSRSLCPRSLEPAEDKDRASSRTRKSSLSSFRGSHHDTMNSNEWPSFPWFSPRHYEHPSRHVRTR